MAFVVGAIVALPTTDGPALTESVQPQPPIFGIVNDGVGGPPFTSISVIWQTGGLAIASLPASVMDEILDADPTEITRLRGKIVRRTSQSSPEYDGVVVGQYKRDRGSSGTPQPNLALVKTTGGTPFYYEVESSELDPVSGR